jgi:UDP-N-acetylglucosamine 2-epimerase (non-hydrolysing)/GDP/UDP-N,N'-diacetylbacillosamine 2-epimerase (hydrolysing)
MIADSPLTELKLVATNMHLSPLFGETYKEIEADGFTIDRKVPILEDTAPDNSEATLKAMSKAIAGMSEAFSELKPDLVLILGDRYEILSAAIAAMIHKIPIAHIGGGNVTEGAYDDAIRHSITKMSHLHFVSTDVYRRRVIQLGELPERVFNVGSIGIENILRSPLMTEEELEKSLNFKVNRSTLLVTYHPVTLSADNVEKDIDAFLSVLEERKDLRIIFTMPNSDTGGHIIMEKINQFVQDHNDRACAFKSLGYKRYLSTMKYVGAVVGNSSSGVVEAPSFHIPTLDIGDRQKGRIAAESVYHCAPDAESIRAGLSYIFSDEFQGVVKKSQNPYEKPDIVKSIFDVISTYPLEGIIKKPFYNLPGWNA